MLRQTAKAPEKRFIVVIVAVNCSRKKKKW